MAGAKIADAEVLLRESPAVKLAEAVDDRRTPSLRGRGVRGEGLGEMSVQYLRRLHEEAVGGDGLAADRLR